MNLHVKLKLFISYNDNYSSNSDLFLSAVTLRLLTEVEIRHPVKLLCDTFTINKTLYKWWMELNLQLKEAGL